MINRSKKIYLDLEIQLHSIAKQEPLLFKRAKRSIMACLLSLDNLKQALISKEFKSIEDEIVFFKTIKPRFYTELIYFAKVLTFEKERPQCNNASQLKFLTKEQKEIDVYFNNNKDFYNYYTTGSTSFDDRYFVRNKIEPHLAIDEFYVHVDPAFNTYHTVKIARILAYKRISSLINEEKLRIEGGPTKQIEIQSSITWTENKVALIELLYALYESGAFNRGTLELKELAIALSKSFNIDLGDFYRTWSEIKIRKEPTKFLDTLKFNLVNRIKVDME